MSQKYKIEQVLLIIVAIILIISGFGKLFNEGKLIGGLSTFDLRMIEDGFGNWMATPLFNRIFTAIEINLGILIITNWVKRSFLSIGLIAVVIVYCIDIILGWNNKLSIDHQLLYLFNQFLTLSIIPFLIVVIILVQKKTEKSSSWLSLLIIIPFFCLPFIISPLYIEDFESKSMSYNKKATDWEIIESKFSEIKININEGEYIIAFFSTNCLHCNQLAKILGVTNRGFGSKKQILIVFPGNEKDSKSFIDRNKADFPFIRVTPDEFTKVAGFAFPSIFSIKNGEILKHWTGDNFSLKVRDEEL